MSHRHRPASVVHGSFLFGRRRPVRWLGHAANALPPTSGTGVAAAVMVLQRGVRVGRRGRVSPGSSGDLLSALFPQLTTRLPRPLSRAAVYIVSTGAVVAGKDLVLFGDELEVQVEDASSSTPGTPATVALGLEDRLKSAASRLGALPLRAVEGAQLSGLVGPDRRKDPVAGGCCRTTYEACPRSPEGLDDRDAPPQGDASEGLPPVSCWNLTGDAAGERSL
ncbi:hypothetical protein MTO96_014799 [Rhipicephalus appendiculatus]